MNLPWPGERTFMQEQHHYDPRYDVRTDAVAAYGIDASFADRVAGWKEHGYEVFLMTGMAWGTYQDYVLGHWDGHDHWDEAQYQMDPVHHTLVPKQHGKDMPYMVPTDSYATYLTEQLRIALAAGVSAIVLEEPEFWFSTGYGPAFQRAWQAHYGQPWRDPATDPLAWIMAARLKQTLYYDLIAKLCRAIKASPTAVETAHVRCYVATHSPLNYTAWGIISPELRLRAIPDLDGIVVQTWNFTARSQTNYEGRVRERLFAVAFLEYGSGIELARGTNRHLWFLADPVEDHPNVGWDVCRSGYEATVAASLCWPEVGAYEVMPWPARVFTVTRPQRPDGTGGTLIPPAYASEILVIANALRTLPAGPVSWDCGTEGIGVLIADSMMWRQHGPQHDDPYLSAFYGLALPPLLAGMPVRPISMEVLAEAVPSDLRVLLLSYDGMTPPGTAAHQALAAWVEAGGALLCFGQGTGPYELLPDWWNDPEGTSSLWQELLHRLRGEDNPGGPWPDLFRRMNLEDSPSAGVHHVGRGVVLVEPRGPRDLAASSDGAGRVRTQIRTALEALGDGALPYREQGYLLVQRGAYVIAALPADSTDNDRATPLRLTGLYIDLFDGDLPTRTEVVLSPGKCAFLLDLDRHAQQPVQDPTGTVLRTGAAPACVLAAAGRIEEETLGAQTLSFRVIGPIGTVAVIRLRLPRVPLHVSAAGTAITAAWDAQMSTALLRHPNDPQGVLFEIGW